MGPDGLLEEELLKGATCDAALATEMRITFAGLPFEKMQGVGAKTYETYKAKYGKEPTSYALYAAEGTRVIIDAIKRAAPAIEKGKDPTEKREALRRGHRGNQELRRHQRQVELRRERRRRLRHHVRLQGGEGGRAHLGCKFQFESILE